MKMWPAQCVAVMAAADQADNLCDYVMDYVALTARGAQAPVLLLSYVLPTIVAYVRPA